MASVVVTLLVLEGHRARPSHTVEQRAALPHVGADAETQRRIEWRERSGDQSGGLLAIDVPIPQLGVAAAARHPGPQRAARVLRRHVTVNPQGLRGAGRAAARAHAGDDAHRDLRLLADLRQRRRGPGDVQRVAGEGDCPAEVLNFGVHGYGTDQMLLRWELEGRRYAPDIVVLAFAYYHLDRNVTGFRFYAKPRFVLERGRRAAAGGCPGARLPRRCARRRATRRRGRSPTTACSLGGCGTASCGGATPPVPDSPDRRGSSRRRYWRFAEDVHRAGAR